MRNLSPCLLGVLCASILNAQPKNDEGYTAKIREYTTESFLTTELAAHLPASATVPTPEKVLGYIVGAPNKLTYTKDIYRYMRELEKATGRVKVFAIGPSEEGREILLVAVRLPRPKPTVSPRRRCRSIGSPVPFTLARPARPRC